MRLDPSPIPKGNRAFPCNPRLGHSLPSIFPKIDLPFLGVPVNLPQFRIRKVKIL